MGKIQPDADEIMSENIDRDERGIIMKHLIKAMGDAIIQIEYGLCTMFGRRFDL